MVTKVRDSIIEGKLSLQPWPCERCKDPRVACIRIEGVVMPEGIEARSTILKDHAGKGIINFIGVSCGCYAKFHRQVTHIQEAMKRNGKK